MSITQRNNIKKNSIIGISIHKVHWYCLQRVSEIKLVNFMNINELAFTWNFPVILR